ncbi:5'/3'-nucleotidase SurE [Sphingomonas aerolata]
MRILLTNDDGYHARGLKVLEAIAATLSDDVWVVAPAEEQSGAGHSLTLSATAARAQVRREALCRRRHADRCGDDGVGPDHEGQPPDLILSGVNRGANLAEDVTYSGTVSAAMEGALAGVRSIALSQVYSREGMGDSVPFEVAAAWGERVLRPLLDAPLAPAPSSTSTSPSVRPMLCAAFASSARACATMAGCRSSPTPTRAAMSITGSRSAARSRRRFTRPIWRLSLTAIFRSRRCISI